MNLLIRPIELVFNFFAEIFSTIGAIAYLLADTIAGIRSGLLSKLGRRLAWTNLWIQMVRVGVRSVPIVSLVLFCIGAILALQMAPVLKSFGVQTTVPDIISIAIFRELGPLVSAIVLTGFAGASIAAELGTMVVSEEIEALEAHAIEPIRFLVVPRIIATTLMMIGLAVIGSISGIIGGMFVCRAAMGMSATLYFTHTFDVLLVRDFITGLVKAGVFGMIISSLACHLGLGVTGGAMGVGVATTRTVVLTIVALIFVDLLFTAVFYAIGW